MHVEVANRFINACGASTEQIRFTPRFNRFWKNAWWLSASSSFKLSSVSCQVQGVAGGVQGVAGGVHGVAGGVQDVAGGVQGVAGGVQGVCL